MPTLRILPQSQRPRAVQLCRKGITGMLGEAYRRSDTEWEAGQSPAQDHLHPPQVRISAWDTRVRDTTAGWEAQQPWEGGVNGRAALRGFLGSAPWLGPGCCSHFPRTEAWRGREAGKGEKGRRPGSRAQGRGTSGASWWLQTPLAALRSSLKLFTASHRNIASGENHVKAEGVRIRQSSLIKHVTTCSVPGSPWTTSYLSFKGVWGFAGCCVQRTSKL